MRECLWLVKNGVPFDVSFALDDITRTGWCIVFSEMEGNLFDFTTMQYRDQK